MFYQGNINKYMPSYNTANKPIIRMIKYHPLLIGQINSQQYCKNVIRLPAIRAAPYDD